MGIRNNGLERFYDIYDVAGREEAEARLARWQGLIAPEYEPFFKELLSSLRNWHDGIFAYFEHPYTNAYVEGVNRLLEITSNEMLSLHVLIDDAEKQRRRRSQRARMPRDAYEAMAQERRTAVVAARAAGMSLRQIATDIGISLTEAQRLSRSKQDRDYAA